MLITIDGLPNSIKNKEWYLGNILGNDYWTYEDGKSCCISITDKTNSIKSDIEMNSNLEPSMHDYLWERTYDVNVNKTVYDFEDEVNRNKEISINFIFHLNNKISLEEVKKLAIEKLEYIKQIILPEVGSEK